MRAWRWSAASGMINYDRGLATGAAVLGSAR
jgi:hypothetical protein